MQNDHSSSLSPRTGVYICGIVNVVSSLMSTQIVRMFGRRSILIWGHIGMTLVHACVGIFDTYKIDNGVLPMILLFIFVYQFSSGPIAWIYAVETTIDVALGIILRLLGSWKLFYLNIWECSLIF
jgi:hypothetical protein